jgi:hypothetical protein
MAHVLDREWDEGWSLVRRVYAPGAGFVHWDEDISRLSGTYDFKTVRYAMEALLVLSESLCQYLARAVGFVFGDGNIRNLKKLRSHLQRSSASDHGLRFADAAWKSGSPAPGTE